MGESMQDIPKEDIGSDGMSLVVPYKAVDLQTN